MKHKRVVARLGLTLVVVGAAGLGLASDAGGQEAPGTYTMTARADTFAFEFVETGAPVAPGGEIFYATPSTAQALLDSLGRSQGYAAAPSPGPFFATLPSNGNGVLAGFNIPFSFPDYPFYAASDHPVTPSSDRHFGPFRARAESDRYGAVGDARSGGLTNDDPAFVSSRAVAQVSVDPDSGLRAAEANSRFDGFTTGPLAIGQSLAHARMTQTPGSPPTKESSFTIGSISIAGVQIAMTDEGFRLGDQAPPTADLTQLLAVLAQAGVTVEYLPARHTDTSIDSAGLRITRAGADPNGTHHKVALILGRVGASIQSESSPLLVDEATVVVPEDDAAEPTPAPVEEPAAGQPRPDATTRVGTGTRAATLPAVTATGPGLPTAAGFTPSPRDQAQPPTATAPSLPPVSAPETRLATPAVAGPFPGPSASGVYAALIIAGLAMAAGTRVVAAVALRAGGGEPPVSVLRLP